MGDRIETADDLGAGEAAMFAYWEIQERIAEKEERPWIKRAREIVKRYRDERPQGGPRISRFNILWSNVQTLQPTLYSRTPRPDVERRFHDQDPTGRLAAMRFAQTRDPQHGSISIAASSVCKRFHRERTPLTE